MGAVGPEAISSGVSSLGERFVCDKLMGTGVWWQCEGEQVLHAELLERLVARREDALATNINRFTVSHV